MLPGMRLAVGLPDLHPGKGTPIGAAFAVDGWLYPTLVGSDIGCGIGLWRTDLPAKPSKREAWADRLQGLDGPWDGDAAAFLNERGVAPAGYEEALGTIGSGNHFAELQMVETIEKPWPGLERDGVYLCVHSGSRGFGEAVLREHTEKCGAQGLIVGTPEADRYWRRHQHAKAWASANRELVARRFGERLRAGIERLVDICHNQVAEAQCSFGACWIHRKGAAPTTDGPVVIPGSRGAFTYLVQPVGEAERSAYSVAHGAGRKWSRTESKGRLQKRYTAKDLTRTDLGSLVICEDKELLYEEAPQAYKNISVVIEDLVEAGLIEVIAVLRPVLTYKVRR